MEEYINSIEYFSLRKDINSIVDNISKLSRIFNLNSELEKIELISILLSNGYLSVTKKYKYNCDIPMIGNLDDLVFEIGVIPIIGEGCCRHTAALIKLILDRMKIKNEVASVKIGIDDYDIEKIKLFLARFHRVEGKANHSVNYLDLKEIDGKIILEVLNNSLGNNIYAIDNGFAVKFFTNQSVYSIYDYSIWYKGKIDFYDSIGVDLDKQYYVKEKMNKARKSISGNMDLLECFYMENYECMKDITNNYKKILVKERGL